MLLALIAIGTLIETAEIWLFELLVDDVSCRPTRAADRIAGAYIALTLIGGLVSFADDYLGTWIAERFLLALRARVLDHVQRLSLDVFDRHRLGDLVPGSTSDVQPIETLVLSGVADGLSAVLQILFFGTRCSSSTGTWRSSRSSSLPLFLLVARVFARLVKRASRESAGAGRLAQLDRRGDVLERGADPGDELASARARRASGARTRASSRPSSPPPGSMASSHPLVDLIELAGVLIVLVFGTGSCRTARSRRGPARLHRLPDPALGPVRELGSLANAFFRPWPEPSA